MKYSSVPQYLESAQAVLVLSSIKLENEIRLQLAAENMQKKFLFLSLLVNIKSAN
jgi:hypothetical protein